MSKVDAVWARETRCITAMNENSLLFGQETST